MLQELVSYSGIFQHVHLHAQGRDVEVYGERVDGHVEIAAAALHQIVEVIVVQLHGLVHAEDIVQINLLGVAQSHAQAIAAQAHGQVNVVQAVVVVNDATCQQECRSQNNSAINELLK